MEDLKKMVRGEMAQCGWIYIYGHYTVLFHEFEQQHLYVVMWHLKVQIFNGWKKTGIHFNIYHLERL